MHGLRVHLILLFSCILSSSSASAFPPEVTHQPRNELENGGSTTPNRGAADNLCRRLQTELGQDVVTTPTSASSNDYFVGATNAWNLFNDDARPACVVFPRNVTNVQATMRGIFQARVRYAVQAGGHGAPKGWNNVDGGVLVHFAHMSDISYDAVKGTATLAPGIKWGDAVAFLEPFGVSVGGGRLSDIGTGLLLGGGISYLSPAYGFSADLYKEVDVVLVNGDLVTATASNKYSDLFRALKGGANRFGIATRYVLETIDTGTKDDKNFFGGLLLYPPDAAEALLAATSRYVSNVKDPNAALSVAILHGVAGGSFPTTHVVVALYRGSSLPNHIFGDFLSIPTAFQNLQPLSYLEASSILGSGDERGSGQLFGASAVTGNLSRYFDIYHHWHNFSQTFEHEFFGTALAFTPILDHQILAGRSKGGNAMDPPLGGYAAVQLQTVFPLGVDTISNEMQKGLKLLFKQVPPPPGLPLYINECDVNQNVFETYRGFEFLKRTYAKYDPTRFNVKFTNGPKGL